MASWGGPTAPTLPKGDGEQRPFGEGRQRLLFAGRGRNAAAGAGPGPRGPRCCHPPSRSPSQAAPGRDLPLCCLSPAVPVDCCGYQEEGKDGPGAARAGRWGDSGACRVSPTRHRAAELSAEHGLQLSTAVTGVFLPGFGSLLSSRTLKAFLAHKSFADTFLQEVSLQRPPPRRCSTMC